MRKGQNVDQEHDFFSAKRLKDIVILSFKENLLLRATDLNGKASLLNYT